MEVVSNVKPAMALISLVMSFLFGGWSILIGALIFFVSFDYLTGVISAGYRGELNARVGFWGIPKKIMIFGVVAIAHIIDQVYLDQLDYPLTIGELDISVMSAAIIYYLFNELISITENLGKMGLTMPVPVLRAVDIFKGTSYYEKNKKDDGE
ncbi:hypothetical protein DH09_08100 [Bacillaceae bacterium JMAK1]|nr:hypothetical protein DH09_08100 [Bacillaceae bacterium JMAK1]